MSDEAMLLAYHLMTTSLVAHQCRFDELPQTAQDRIQQQVERALQMEQLVLSSPLAADVVIPDSLLQKSMASIKGRYEAETDFIADLTLNGLTQSGLEQALARELKADATLERVAWQVPQATEAEVRAWYDAHPERFSIGETRDARHILITINEDIEENRRDASLERINGVLEELDGTQERFAEAALRYSECPSALNGGTLGRVAKDTLYAELDKTLFAMDADTTSTILESEAGFHILYCEAVYPAQKASYEEAAPKIKAAIDKKRQTRAQKAFIASLLKDNIAERKVG